MKNSHSFFLRYLSIASIALISFCTAVQAQEISLEAASEGLKEARELCSSIGEQEKRLAKTAGYDLDKLCGSLDLIEFPGSEQPEEPLVTPRQDKQSPSAATQSNPDKQTQPQHRLKIGSLQPFGYDLFAGEPSDFEQASRIPVSPDYLLGPGDTIELGFYGKLNDSHSLEISRDGSIDFPHLGPINLAGMTFSDARQLLQQRIKHEMLGVQASISLGELRSIQVFMLGEAYKPGTYTVSALSTITNALFLSGGLSDIASLRNLQLKRGGKLISTLDLYDLLLSGDTSRDVQLQSGDAIYVPTVKETASVDGAVRRPAIYELKGKVTAHQLVELAGGLEPNAFNQSARISRVGNGGFMQVLDLDLTTPKGKNTPIKSGDRLTIDETVEQQELIVTLSGHVHYPGEFLWRDGLRISDVLKNIKALKPDVDLDFALIRRELPPVGKIEPIFVDLGAVLANPQSEFNIQFFPKDQLIVFSNEKNRAALLQELAEELRLQARSGEMARIANINGTVRSPGEYPLTKGMTVTQLIAAAGGLSEEAYTQVVELSRYDFSNIEKSVSDHFSITLSDAFKDPQKDPQLSPYDSISVRSIPEFRENLSLEIRGEVRFPGAYTFKRGETLAQVIARAGGVTELAHLSAAVFTRKDLRDQEAKQLAGLRQRLRSEIAASGLEKANEGKSGGADSSARILEQLDATEALGRLVIDLGAIVDGSMDDVSLKDGDLLVIPEYRQEISVLGEVQHSSAHLFNSRLDITNYIELSGGINHRGDKKRIYVVKADGSVVLPKRSGWFKHRRASIAPGDTIIVPLDVDRRRALTIWGEASAIIYQLALGAAAINSF
jgi:protein involved in polysaccharide export with SLBB domain